MRKHCTGVIAAVVVAFSVSVTAQSQSPANVPPADAGAQKTAPAQPAQARAADAVTITGCIQSAPASARSAAAGGPSFVLANAEMSGSRTTGGAVGTAGSTSTSYRLEGEEKMISPHLNHQVRITGTVQPGSASATGAAGGSTAATAMLKVDKVEMVSATCETTPSAAPRTAPAQPSAPSEPGRTEKPAQPGQPSVPPDRQ